ncbi:MAG: cytochrome c [Pseudomonadota bacterium]
MRLALILTILALPAVAQDVEEGEMTFLDHCAGCHGVTARGDGPLATLMTTPPPDLTELAMREGGAFPLARVVQRIDGTTEVQAHGGPMPIFGLLMEGPSVAMLGPDGEDVIVPEGIAQIAAWLMEMQR